MVSLISITEPLCLIQPFPLGPQDVFLVVCTLCFQKLTPNLELTISMKLGKRYNAVDLFSISQAIYCSKSSCLVIAFQLNVLLIFAYLFIFVDMCIPECTHVGHSHVVPAETGREPPIAQDGSFKCCKPPCGCWEQSPRLLQEQPGLSITEQPSGPNIQCFLTERAMFACPTVRRTNILLFYVNSSINTSQMKNSSTSK